MKNITLAIDEAVLRGVRIYAAEHETTVNALVRDFLTGLAGEKLAAAELEERRAQARRELVELSKRSAGRLGPGWKWNREALYEDRLFPRHEHSGLRGFGEGDGGGEKKKGR
jgi:hypothetical protein